METDAFFDPADGFTLTGFIDSLGVTLVGMIDADSTEWYIENGDPAQDKHFFQCPIFRQWRDAQGATFTLEADVAEARALPSSFTVISVQPDGTGLVTLQLYAE